MAENTRYFQFVVGPHRGEILVFDKIEREDDVIYIKFKDNSRIDEIFVAQINQRDLTNKLMAEIDSPLNCWQFREKLEDEKPRLEKDAQTGEIYEIPSVEDFVHAELNGEAGVVNPKVKKKTIYLIPPRLTPPTHSVFGQISSSTTQATIVNNNPVIDIKTQSTAPNEAQQANSDPVWLMCNSAKKFDTDVTLTLTISLPKKSLYNVAKESFEKGGEKVVEYVIQNLEDSVIRNSLRQALLESYNDKEITILDGEKI